MPNISADSCPSLPSSYQLQSINQDRGDKLQTPLHSFWMVLHFGNDWNSVEQERVEFPFSAVHQSSGDVTDVKVLF